MVVNYRSYELPFHDPFTIAKGSKTHQPTLLVSLDYRGVTGYGEAPAIGYYGVTIEKLISDIESKRKLIEQYAFTEPERFWHYLHHLFPGNNFLVAALDIAYWDLFGKARKSPLKKMWDLEETDSPLTDYTIGIDSTEIMIRKMDEKPWPVYKIKMGNGVGIDTIEQLRKHTEGLIRVDVNEGWSREEAMQYIPQLAQLGVELIEQPLQKDDWEGMKLLYKHSKLPLIADESCVGEYDVEKCEDHFHGVNIKLTKCGGITPAVRMIDDAKEFGLKVMLGSMNESTIGTAAIAHLAPLADYLDCDGPLLLKEDVASGLLFEHGKVTTSAEPGLGVSLFESF